MQVTCPPSILSYKESMIFEISLSVKSLYVSNSNNNFNLDVPHEIESKQPEDINEETTLRGILDVIIFWNN